MLFVPFDLLIHSIELTTDVKEDFLRKKKEKKNELRVVVVVAILPRWDALRR